MIPKGLRRIWKVVHKCDPLRPQLFSQLILKQLMAIQFDMGGAGGAGRKKYCDQKAHDTHHRVLGQRNRPAGVKGADARKAAAMAASSDKASVAIRSLRPEFDTPPTVPYSAVAPFHPPASEADCP